ncbi:hypothetical protein A605_04290 [Corynebacterium halotolerans YIM 70093 = DSM 44683]|uniref:RDD domain-containing protein n=2 Tax=Corynebacterium halotolerans TaxID=225326 RepID=M1MVU5_9CORY|nr:hypothetical protein A605_04290 [Corynebacterium halotolerans YIM 70093 = DSM 44683]
MADDAGVPGAASITRRFGAFVFEAILFILVFSGLHYLAPQFAQSQSVANNPLVLLVLAAVRILGEALWATSPGKYVTGLQVVFHTRTGGRVAGWQRLPRAALRNGWLWLPAVMVLIDPSFTWYNGLASAVALTVLIRWDNRSLADLLAGPEVLSVTHTVPAPASRKSPWPTSSPPQRALAWAIDLAVAALVGTALTQVTGWSFWLDTLTVLGLMRVITEWVGLPTPGKAVMGLRVYHLPWFDVKALVFLQVLVRNLWVPVAVAYAASPYATPLLFEGLVMAFILVFPDHRGVMDWLANAHVTDVRGTESPEDNAVSRR